MSSPAIRNYPIKPMSSDIPMDKGLSQALLTSVAEHYEQLRGRRIWLACSGGRDSLTLAGVCAQLYRQGKLPFLPQLLHVDHNLQAGSAQWAMHVEAWARAQQMPCYVLQAHVKGADEQAARKARYKAMLAHINQGDVLLLGHHADDQAETVLMRLIQGAGVNGLAGMMPLRVQQTGARQHVLWRPWLSVRRTNITTYAERLKLPYIDDPTNDNGDNIRSGLRRDILPVLTRYNTNVVENIARSAQLLGDAKDIVNAQAEQDLAQASSSFLEPLQVPPVQRVLNIDQLQILPLARRRQLLHYWLTQDEPLPPAKQLIDDVFNLAYRTDQNHQTQLYWQARQHSYTIRRFRQQLYRLSSQWLEWLTDKIPEQTQPLYSFNQTTSQPLLITVRHSQDYHWQLKVALDKLPIKISDTTRLNLAPLGRQQKIKTAHSSRAQAGKKLYQTLAIPVWLRDSLVVVSLNFVDNNNKAKVAQIALASPFEVWRLESEDPALHTPVHTVQSILHVN
ncbi:tRNA lysidine(34) synthetase TilS [Psychrobacter sp. DM4]|uniref:tRNA lysidine(34) synthetase TilS n=1 Tax=Psychrobacter sp. DM4 TaxID=3440637 RepID=UPI003F5072F6